MSDYFLGEIRLFSFPEAPDGWALCDGSEMSIADYEGLYALIGSRFGGDGRKTFRLPDLRGRVPVHPHFASKPREPIAQGQRRGAEAVTLTQETLPAHTHTFFASNEKATAANASKRVLGEVTPDIQLQKQRQLYGDGSQHVTLHPGSISIEGGGQAHSNIQPYAALNFCIAITGIYPPRA